MTTFPADFLPWRGIFDDSQMLGLFNSSLYQVLQNTTNGRGHVEVSAIGFNITCGYLPVVLNRVDLSKQEWDFSPLGSPSMDPDGDSLSAATFGVF